MQHIGREVAEEDSFQWPEEDERDPENHIMTESDRAGKVLTLEDGDASEDNKEETTSPQ